MASPTTADAPSKPERLLHQLTLPKRSVTPQLLEPQCRGRGLRGRQFTRRNRGRPGSQLAPGSCRWPAHSEGSEGIRGAPGISGCPAQHPWEARGTSQVVGAQGCSGLTSGTQNTLAINSTASHPCWYPVLTHRLVQRQTLSRTYSLTQAHTRACIITRAHSHRQAYKYPLTHVCTRTHTGSHVCTHMCACAHTYTHTHRLTSSHSHTQLLRHTHLAHTNLLGSERLQPFPCLSEASQWLLKSLHRAKR